MSAESQQSRRSSTTKRKARPSRLLGGSPSAWRLPQLGLYVGRELRSRYKFKRRTPYDFYSNAGNQQSTEFGVGI